MEHAHIDDTSAEVLRVRYRDHSAWLYALFMLAIVGSRFLQGRAFAFTIPSLVWAVGIVLIVVNGVLTALRTERGLTLDMDGVTWHRTELFIPWSQVTALELGTNTKGRGEQRLIVRTLDPTEALYGQRGLAKLAIQANIQQFGGPIAMKAHLLGLAPEAVIAAADRLRHAAADPGDPIRQARRARALSLANFWAIAGSAGLVAGLATILLRNIT